MKKKNCSTVFCFMSQLRVEPTKNSSLTGKKQLPTQQITTAERLKHKCRNSKNNCRTIKKQLPRPKTTAEMSKDNCRTSKTQLPKSWAVENRPTVCVGLHKTTSARSKNNCRTAKHNCRIIKKQMPKYEKKNVEKSKGKNFNLSKNYNF